MLTGKQQRYLRALGHHERPIVHVGKQGITETVLRQVAEALAARELVKGRVLEASLTPAAAVAARIAAETGAELVQVIGRNFILFKRDPTEPKIRIPD